MIRINDINLPIEYCEKDLQKKIARILRVDTDNIGCIEILRKSIDARKKHEIHFVVSVALDINDEERILNKCRDSKVSYYEGRARRVIDIGDKKCSRPIVVGFGPAGIFAALTLAEHGYRPIILERGKKVEDRKIDVERFWQTEVLDTNSNVCFGEGGAGTFSDGKLNTLVKDPYGRNFEVLNTFVKFGADPSILYENKPHIGTDKLIDIVSNIRKYIECCGGEFKFSTTLEDIMIDYGRIRSIKTNQSEEILCDILVLAIGHSARDTYKLLYDKGIDIQQKDFAIGIRVQHPQELIDKNQYGMVYDKLPHASYKMTTQSSGRGVYTFCMCPGGYVVNSSSDEEHLCINGMSYHDRNSGSANAAVIVTTNKSDYMGSHPLAGVEFQRQLERNAFDIATGSIPVQLYGDYEDGKISSEYGSLEPQFKGQVEFADINKIFPDDINKSIKEAMYDFGKKIKGYDDPDVIIAAIESRTSSPIRIPRNEVGESNISGIYPCGEGAGYAGGITSAAMDGIKIAEDIMRVYKPIE